MKSKIEYLKYKQQIINHIISLVNINSVYDEQTKNNQFPFGIGCANALKYVENLAKDLGFKVNNYDNYVVEVEYDNNASQTLGILVHVDVVPANINNWDSNPFNAIIKDDKIIGRGVLDDKGPAIINLFALKAIKDLGIKLNKNIKIIFGSNEETGSKCLDYYFNTLKKPQPDIAYTPDAEFPVIFAEKGIIRLNLNAKFKTMDDYQIYGGDAYNSVASDCFVLYKNKQIYNQKGKAAHAAKPFDGINAISNLFNLKDLNINNDEFNHLKLFFNEYIKLETNGKSLGISCADQQSGELTFNIGFINLKNNLLQIGLDIRTPVTYKVDNIIEQIKTVLPKWLELEIVSIDQPLYFSKDDYLIKTLMDIYYKHTNDYDAKPLSIGGGTYARKVKYGVAFGALLKEQIDNMHQANESLDIKYIEKIFDIYVDAIYELTK